MKFILTVSFLLWLFNRASFRLVFVWPPNGIDFNVMIDQNEETIGPAAQIVSSLINDVDFNFGPGERQTRMALTECGRKEFLNSMRFTNEAIEDYVQFANTSNNEAKKSRKISNCFTSTFESYLGRRKDAEKVFLLITDGRFDVANDDLPEKSQLSRKKVFVILTYHMQKREISKVEFDHQYLPKIKAMFNGDERFIIPFKDSHDILEKFVEGGVGNKTYYPDCILGSRLTDCFFDEKSRCLQINLTFIKQQPHADHGDPCPKLNNETVFCDLKMCQSSPMKSPAFSTNVSSNSKGKSTAASVKGTLMGKSTTISIKGTSQSVGKGTAVSAQGTSIPMGKSAVISVNGTSSSVAKRTAISVKGISMGKSAAVSDKEASIAKGKISATSDKGTSSSTRNTVKGASKGKMTAVSVKETLFSTGMSVKGTSMGKITAISVNGTSSSTAKSTSISAKETSSCANVTASSAKIQASENNAVFFVEKSSNQTRISYKSSQVALQEKMPKMDTFPILTTSVRVKPESRRAKNLQKTKASEISEFDNDKKESRYLTSVAIKTTLTNNISQATGETHIQGKINSIKPEAPKEGMPVTESKWKDGVAIWVVSGVAILVVLILLIMILVFWQHRSKTKIVVIAKEKEDAVGPGVRISEKTRSVEVDISSNGSTNSRSRNSKQIRKFSKSFIQKFAKSSASTNRSFKSAIPKSRKSVQVANQDEEDTE